MLFGAGDPLEGAAQVPIRGVKNAHDYDYPDQPWPPQYLLGQWPKKVDDTDGK